MTDPLERQIRAALSARAAQAPARDVPPATLSARPRAQGNRAAAAIALAASAVLVVAVSAAWPDDQRLAVRRAERVPAAAQDAPTGIPRVGFDQPGFSYRRVEDCPRDAARDAGHYDRDGRSASPQPAAVPGDVRLQTFAPSYSAAPMIFLQTVEPAQRPSFGLHSPDTGVPFTARGATGYASADHGTAAGWSLSLELDGGRALYAIVLGLELDDVVPVVDALRARRDGGWDAPVLPPGARELPASTTRTDCAYSASGALDGVSGEFEVNLYGDRFDSRLADRVSSTTGSVEAVTLDDVDAVLGSYRGDDHWVMFEPQPGRTMEIRLSGMSRQDALRTVAHARFVDEATWQAMKPR